jgi:hypothetical protein
MGEILFSLFIGGCLIAVGVYMNVTLHREQRRSRLDHDNV